MIVVISYDVVDNRRRRRLASLLENYGRRVQKSVFDCSLGAPRILALKRAVSEEIDPGVDSIRYYHLCRRCAEQVEVVGVGTVTRQTSLVFV